MDVQRLLMETRQLQATPYIMIVSLDRVMDMVMSFLLTVKTKTLCEAIILNTTKRQVMDMRRTKH